MMPRRGTLELTADMEIAQYYVDSAQNYLEELGIYGIGEVDAQATIDSFITTIEKETGVRRGMGEHKLANV